MRKGFKKFLRVVFFAGCGCIASGEAVLNATEFGLHADGKTDDGPAIRALLERAQQSAGPVTLRFPEEREIYVATGTEQFVFRLDRVNHLSIDGGGSTFLIDKELRFLHATVCSNLTVRNLNVDMTPAPVVEAVILKQQQNGRILTVQLDRPEQAAAPGGPTREDDEQDFFGMLWFSGNYAAESSHYYIDDVTAESERHRMRGQLRIHSKEGLPPKYANRIIPGKTRISLPVPGIAHRYGPSSMIRIDRCKGVEMEDVDVWSAPWFAFQIFRNDGTLIFRRVHIRPKPGSGRLTSSWRDGFHVKGNKGSLLFEECILEGMNDDAFNISTHAWEVTEVVAPNRLKIKQIFPIQAIPPQTGGELLVLSSDGAVRLALARITAVDGLSADDEAIYLPGHRRAPVLELSLDRSLDGLEPGCVLWDSTVANPQTVIRRCRIGNSCRFQSPVTLEECDISAFVWFYSEELEGPMPSGSVVRGCTFRQGRGNDRYALSFNGWRSGSAPAQLPDPHVFPLQNIRVENNRIYGGLHIDGVYQAVLTDNKFPDGTGSSRITSSLDILIKRTPVQTDD
jgi:hypothetical protein